MDIPKFLKKTLDKVVTEQQINSKKLCKTCYETLFELNEYDKRIQNSLKHMNALKSKIKCNISKPDSLPPSPECENEENPEFQDDFKEAGDLFNETNSKKKSAISEPDSFPSSPEPENESQEEHFEEDGAGSSQEDFSQEDSELPEPNVSEDDTMNYEFMEEQDDARPISMLELEPQESQEIEPTALKKDLLSVTNSIQIMNVVEIEGFQKYMVQESDNEENLAGTLLVLPNGQYSTSDGFDIIEYNDDYSQVGGSKMGDDDLNDDPDDPEEDFDLKIDCNTELDGKYLNKTEEPLKVEEDVSETLVRSFHSN